MLIVRDMADKREVDKLHPNLVHTEWMFVKDFHKLNGWTPDHVIVTEWATQHPLYTSYPNGLYYTVSKLIARGARYTCLVS